MQPVLQWGSSAAGGGAYWSAACWYVTQQAAFYTQPFNVNPGDSIVGSVGRVEEDASNYVYYCTMHMPGVWSWLGGIRNVPEMYQAMKALEAYGPTLGIGDLPQCDLYPATDLTPFTVTTIRTNQGQASLTWTTAGSGSCGTYAAVVSNANPGGQVDLHYPPPPPPPPPPPCHDGHFEQQPEYDENGEETGTVVWVWVPDPGCE